MEDLDRRFDVIVCQTPFHGIDLINDAKIVMVQYGYAKSAHNYGAWRSLADLTLVYGDVAAQHISRFCPVDVIGCHRFDDWRDEEWRADAVQRHKSALDRGKPILLYAPTWGELSSSDRYLDSLLTLRTDFTLIVKIHHNVGDQLRLPDDVIRCGREDDLFSLMSVCDALVSDYSGAIFDAVLCRVPTILLDMPTDCLVGNKTEKGSLEVGRREELGLRIASPTDLSSARLQEAFDDPMHLLARSDRVRSELFYTGHATERFITALTEISSERRDRPEYQIYVRNEVRERLAAQRALRQTRRELKAKLRDLRSRSITLPFRIRGL